MTPALPESDRGLARLVSSWKSDPSIAPNIAAWKILPATAARTVAFPREMHPALVASLRARGIRSLYCHQATAWEHARAGRHIVVVTGTASGKTLCYNLPVLDHLYRDKRARALYLFPTKALAQDQRTTLEEFVKSGDENGIAVGIYDGDTPGEVRPAMRLRSNIVISNPDMLHAGILPHHTLWADLFRNLRFVVIDEMHTYRGVFGSHVANVIRRLKRIAAFYGAHPQFILTSATIGNPLELANRLVEETPVAVEEDGSARGLGHLLIVNPPIVNRQLGLRRGALQEGVRLVQALLHDDVQTIIFGRTRRAVEIMLKYLNESSSSTVRGYRSGYLPRERREIERGLREGEVRAVVATNALELGIDIGDMGAAILVGYPGTIAAARQQSGRAGRKTDMSLAVLVASSDPLDQFLVRHPDYLLERSPEHALVNPDNLLILLQHLRCAAFELPFREGEGFGRAGGAQVAELLEFLTEGGILHRSGNKYFWMADAYPSSEVSLRSASADTVVLQAEGKVIGQVDLASANWMVHPEAIYLHEARSYLVQALDLGPRPGLAHLVPSDADYYTEPRREARVQLLEQLEEAPVRGGLKVHGEIAVTTLVTGYRKIQWFTHENLGEGTVSLPPTELHTTGYWLVVADETVQRLRALGAWTNDPNDYGPEWPRLRERALARDDNRCASCGVVSPKGGLHVHHKIPFRAFSSREQANQLDNLVSLCRECHQQAEMAVRLRSGLAGLAHLLGHLAPLFLMCDSRDIGVHSDPQSPLAKARPCIAIYDQIPAGIGFSERLYELHDELIARSFELVSGCECEDGCPSCVGPGGENGYGGKRETRSLLEELAGHTAS